MDSTGKDNEMKVKIKFTDITHRWQKWKQWNQGKRKEKDVMSLKHNTDGEWGSSEEE